MATLINGNLNSPIYAAQDADLLAAICGNTTCVTPVGEQFAETLEDANTIMVADGVIITKEGRRIQIDAGDIDEFLIPTGTQGQTQYFICGYHLYTDEDSAELCETFVEPVDSASEVITENTFRGGATEVYVSLLRVKQVGVQIDTITRLLPSSTTISQIKDSLNGKQDKLDNPLTQSDVINNLTSTSITKPLSANQGKVLNDNLANGSIDARFSAVTIGSNSDLRLYKNGNQLVIRTGDSSNYTYINTSDILKLVSRFITTPVVAITEAYNIANLVWDVGQSAFGFKFFTNWTNPYNNFPENYGSGVCIKCADSRDFMLLYMTTSNKLYIGHYNTSSGVTWSEK